MRFMKYTAIIALFAVSALAFGLLSSPALAATLLVDFEGGIPSGWFEFAGGGASLATNTPTVGDTDPLARPDQVGDNILLEANFNAATGFAGFGQDFSATTGAQNWSSFIGVSFCTSKVNSTNSGCSMSS